MSSDPRTDQTLALPELAGGITVPGTGEVLDLTKYDDVLKAGYILQELARQARNEKSRVDSVARWYMQHRASSRIDNGGYEATQETGSAEYDPQRIYDEAISLGIPQDAVERMIPLVRKVEDGRELNKLASRDDLWRQALAAGTTRKPGRVKYGVQKAGLVAPLTPKVIQQEVASRQDAEAAASDLGI